MTDRDLDLIEAAGKAAGLKLQLALGFTEGDREFFTPDGKPWNPLADDGDALRLAVALRIDIRLFALRGTAGRPHDQFASAMLDREGRCFNEAVSDDPAAATRRAIVRAAAAMTGEGGAP